jgi:2-oxo-4-hydroxy-4-carboxy-5-ureidoimidazoline decarboxylase
MVAAVKGATRDEKLALLRAHPELAGKEAHAGSMTRSSVAEQASAGLDRLTDLEIRRLAELNAGYLATHGFPFIIAVHHYTKEGIFHEFARRLRNDSASELEAALEQVYAIARIRLPRCSTRNPAERPCV